MLRDKQNRLVAVKGEGFGRGMEWEVRGFKSLYRGWINNKVPLYSTENYI